MAWIQAKGGRGWSVENQEKKPSRAIESGTNGGQGRIRLLCQAAATLWLVSQAWDTSHLVRVGCGGDE